ncbi:TPA: hypothetical protein JLI26_003527 [Escherichia coli]|nr:hypothetical protein [Escherichia coli]
MPIISGTLIDGAGQPVPDCQILLRALNTTSNVVVTTTASVGTNAGRYRIEAQPARYEVTLAMEGWPPKKVGVIDVYADSPDGTLNDFLTVVSGDYLTPDALKQFEQMAQQAREAAEQAELAASGMDAIRQAAEDARDDAAREKEEVARLAHQTGLDAQAAAMSERHAGDFARQSDESAQASERSSQASAGSAASAYRSEQNAATSEQSSATSARNAKSSEDASARSETRAEEHAVRAENAAKTAAADAVAEAVPVAAAQLRGELTEQVSRVEEVAAEVNRNKIAAADSERQAGIHEQGAQQALKDAQDIAKTAAADAVAEAVPVAAAQLRGELTEQVSRVEEVAAEVNRSKIAAADSERQAGIHERGAQQALKDAQDIAKTPGPSAYDVWVSQQPWGSDTSMEAFMEYIRGSDGGIISPGDVGSYVLGYASGGGGFGSEIEGRHIKLGGLYLYGNVSIITENVVLTGTWQAMGYFRDVSEQLTLFQRIR